MSIQVTVSLDEKVYHDLRIIAERDKITVSDLLKHEAMNLATKEELAIRKAS